jgi:hypothetical protein
MATRRGAARGAAAARGPGRGLGQPPVSPRARRCPRSARIRSGAHGLASRSAGLRVWGREWGWMEGLRRERCHIGGAVPGEAANRARAGRPGEPDDWRCARRPRRPPHGGQLQHMRCWASQIGGAAAGRATGLAPGCGVHGQQRWGRGMPSRSGRGGGGGGCVHNQYQGPPLQARSAAPGGGGASGKSCRSNPVKGAVLRASVKAVAHGGGAGTIARAGAGQREKEEKSPGVGGVQGRRRGRVELRGRAPSVAVPGSGPGRSLGETGAGIQVTRRARFGGRDRKVGRARLLEAKRCGCGVASAVRGLSGRVAAGEWPVPCRWGKKVGPARRRNVGRAGWGSGARP